jgi:hypothetical protein
MVGVAKSTFFEVIGSSRISPNVAGIDAHHPADERPVAKGLTNSEEKDALYQIEADYEKLFAKGKVCITILLDVQGTLITATTTTNEDTIWASSRIPGKLILLTLKFGLWYIVGKGN